MFSGWQRCRKFLAATIASATLLTSVSPMALAQGRSIHFLRDAETEQMLRDFSNPLFEVSTVNGDDVNIALINDSSLNAFVAGGQNLFVHTGLIMKADTPEQIIGVLAHELGHIEGGHLVKGQEAIGNASTQAIITTLIGIGVGLATGEAGAGGAVVLGGQEAAKRGFLSFSRAHENAADHAALRYLTDAGISAKGLLSFMEKLEDQELLPANRQDEYVRTHPLTRDRVSTVRSYMERLAQQEELDNTPLDPELERAFHRVQAKLLGYLHPQTALRRYKADDNSEYARYARAVALYRQTAIKSSLDLTAELLEEFPNDPFYHELTGQILRESGRIEEALPHYRQAVTLLPQSALLQTDLAQTILQHPEKTDEMIDEALEHLAISTQIKPRSASTWRQAAIAWGLKENKAMLTYSLAEEASAKSDHKTALQLSRRAQELLPTGSPAWLRAQDIETNAARAEERR